MLRCTRLDHVHYDSPDGDERGPDSYSRSCKEVNSRRATRSPSKPTHPPTVRAVAVAACLLEADHTSYGLLESTAIRRGSDGLVSLCVRCAEGAQKDDESSLIFEPAKTLRVPLCE